ncbi:cytochrome c oxidase subunit 3 [Portibacter marinus]|uniref:cytochrome c oxidase subunit 3 n=1 Tax=Portibacter marinus TaxID=2898660 RepID=UPI001F36566C|nr:cytochrome c oxidase subunit 3 [Portibacter marinus]
MSIKNRINPQLFGLWTAMASITMMFGALTSAYIVRQAAGNWLEFRLPDLFIVSTIVILTSSVTLHMAFNAYKNQKEILYKVGLAISFVLGIAFLVLQYNAWMELFNTGIDMKINPSGSFLYVITAAHAAHIIGGIAALTLALLHAFTLKFEYTDQRKKRFQLVLHYWHFVDLLWVYLFVFLLLYR